MNIYHENPFNLSEIKKVLPTYFHQCMCTGVYSSSMANTDRNRHTIAYRMEQKILAINYFAGLLLCQRKSNQFFITLMFGCYGKQLDTPPLCEIEHVHSLPIGNSFICLSTYSMFIAQLYSLRCETHSPSNVSTIAFLFVRSFGIFVRMCGV